MTVLYWAYSIADVFMTGCLLACIITNFTHLRRPREERHAATDAMEAWVAIPYLVALVPWVAGHITFDWSAWSWFHVGVRVVIAAILWRRFKNRRNKRRRAAKLLARVREAGHRLVIVPVPTGGRA